MSKKAYRLAVFDMDGVLTSNPSSWEFVHRSFGVDNSANFRLYRQGKLPYIEFLRSDVSLWIQKNGPISADHIIGILDQIPLRKGISETVTLLRERGIRSAIVSGGIYWLAEKIARTTEFVSIYANKIKTDSSNFLIPDGEVMVEPGRKDIAIREIQRTLGIGAGETISIGDTSQDVAMFRNSAISIAFNPVDSSLGQKATAEISGDDVSAIIEVIDQNSA